MTWSSQSGKAAATRFLCAIRGIYDYQPIRPDRTRRLEQSRTGDGRALPLRLKAEIARELQRMELVLQMLEEIVAERDAIASARMSAHTNAKIQDLVKRKAIGPEIATVLTGEVLYRPFDNRRELASYVGLTPSHFQSGSTCRDQGISKAGNPKDRTTMIESAWLWPRHQPDSAFSVWFRERVGNLKGRIRRITIVTMARKLLIALWCYLEPPVLQCRIGTSGWASLPNMRALHNCLKRKENDLALKL
jgi:transposase